MFIIWYISGVKSILSFSMFYKNMLNLDGNNYSNWFKELSSIKTYTADLLFSVLLGQERISSENC